MIVCLWRCHCRKLHLQVGKTGRSCRRCGSYTDGTGRIYRTTLHKQ